MTTNMYTPPLSANESSVRPGGYALLTALVISALIISIATSIASVTVRQMRTHSIISDSFIAQNAAMAGYECAYFWDTDPAVIEAQHLGAFYPDPIANLRNIRCFNVAIDPSIGFRVEDPITGHASTTVSFVANIGTTGCVEVSLTKGETSYSYSYFSDPTPYPVYQTTITANGYNSQLVAGPGGTQVCDKTGSTVVERSVFVDIY